MNSGKVLLGVLAGVAAGALIGVLFAPSKGSRTRKRILKKGEDYADGLKEKFEDVLAGVSKKIEKIKEDVNDFTEQAHTRSEEVKEELKTVKG
ncbi:MAG: YtxH domain-containing protein [Bacteroidota bacterium]